MYVLPELYTVEFVLLSMVIHLLFTVLTLYLLNKGEDRKGEGWLYGYLAALTFISGAWVFHLLQASMVFGLSLIDLFTDHLSNSLWVLLFCAITTVLFYHALRYWERSNTSVLFGAILFTIGMVGIYLSGWPLMQIRASITVELFSGIEAMAASLVCSYLIVRYFKELTIEPHSFANHFLVDATAVGVALIFLQFTGMRALTFTVGPEELPQGVVSSSSVIIFVSILMVMMFLTYIQRYKEKVEEYIHEEHYHSLFHNSPSMLCMVNVKGELIKANDPFLRNTDIQSIYIPKRISSLFKDPEWIEQQLTRSIHGKRIRYQTVIKVKETELSVIVTHIPIKKKEQVSGVIVQLQDITELEEAKKDALGRLHIQETIFSTLSEGLFVHDLTGKTIEVNERASELLGIDRSESYKINPLHVEWDFITEGGDPINNEDLPSVKALREESTQENEILGIRRGHRDIQWISINASPLYLYGKHEGVVITFSDVTSTITKTFQLREANTELKKTIATVQEENKAKSEFLSRMSHELRTPLNSIIGYSELILENYEREKELEHSDIQKIKKIFRAGEHLHNLINEVLDVTRHEFNQLNMREETVELVETLNSSIDLVMPEAQKNQIGIHLTMDANPSYVVGDRLFLKQAIVNLLDNAIKYNRHYGHVYVTTKTTEEVVIISIKDEGIGIDRKHHMRIFEPFYRVPSTLVKGTGIGLSVVRQTVEMMGGDCGVISSQAGGSTFWISIPLKGDVSKKVD